MNHYESTPCTWAAAARLPPFRHECVGFATRERLRPSFANGALIAMKTRQCGAEEGREEVAQCESTSPLPYQLS
jgi:hypothetical protein